MPRLNINGRISTSSRITPARNLAAKRAWREMGTVGSRGIRTSQDHVRRGDAAARTLLLQPSVMTDAAMGKPVRSLPLKNSKLV